MSEALQKILKITLVLFMVGNLLDMGLRLNLRDALGGLRNVRFVVQSVAWGFVCARLWPTCSRRSSRWNPRMPLA